MNVDYIVVGLGIAGSALCEHFEQSGISFIVLDDPEGHSASKVAAGLFNPVTGKHSKKTWLADDLFTYLESYYPALEQKLKAKFFYPKGIFIPFQSIENQNDWLSLTSDPRLHAYVDKVYLPNDSPYPRAVNHPFGGISLKKAGFIESKALLSAHRQHLENQGKYRASVYDEAKLEIIGSNAVRYDDIEANGIIYANGYQCQDSMYFGDLRFASVQGDILEVDIPELDIDQVINKKCWMVPQNSGTYKVGSSYDRKLTLEPSEHWREDILERLKLLTPLPFEVKNHAVGIRPATYDRKPFLGWHHTHPQIGIFNGMGTKGFSLAPFFANQLTQNILHEATILAEVDIARMYKKRGLI